MRNIILVLGLLICVSVSCTKTYPNKVESVGCDLTQLEHFFLERPEIIEKDSLIQVITNGRHGVSFVHDSTVINDVSYYQIKVGYNNVFRFETYYNFYIDRTNCNILIEDMESGCLIPLSEWRNNKDNNKERDKYMPITELPFNYQSLLEECGSSSKYKLELTSSFKAVYEVISSSFEGSVPSTFFYLGCRYGVDIFILIENQSVDIDQEGYNYDYYLNTYYKQYLVTIKDGAIVDRLSLDSRYFVEDDAYYNECGFFISKDYKVQIYAYNITLNEDGGKEFYFDKRKEICTYKILEDGKIIEVN